MKQTKIKSLIESFTDVAVGILINMLVIQVVFQISISDSLALSTFMLLLALARRYIIRRLFNN